MEESLSQMWEYKTISGCLWAMTTSDIGKFKTFETYSKYVSRQMSNHDQKAPENASPLKCIRPQCYPSLLAHYKRPKMPIILHNCKNCKILPGRRISDHTCLHKRERKLCYQEGERPLRIGKKIQACSYNEMIKYEPGDS